LTGARFAQDPIHQLFFSGANQFGFNEGIFLYEGIEERLRCVDRHRRIPDQLAFFLCGFDEAGLRLGVKVGDDGQTTKNDWIENI
jgi:hypothetical protein